VDETAILAVVDRFMHAVSSSDAAAIAKLCLENSSNIIERPAEGALRAVS
jgi:hypothetical protein